jgi:hypothetical protein
MVIGLIPIVGGIYDVVSLGLERDLISGRPLTTVDRAIMSAGLLFSTLGFVDGVLEGGSRLLRHLDEVDAAGGGRGLSHLDEFTAGDRALLRGDELRRALGGFDERGGLARRLSHLDEATAARLRNFVEGPMLLNPDEALAGIEPPIGGGHQLAIFTERAVDLLQPYLR